MKLSKLTLIAAALVPAALLWLRWRREKKMREEMQDGGWL